MAQKMDDLIEGGLFKQEQQKGWIHESVKPPQTRREESDRVLVYAKDIHGDKSISIMRYNHVQGFWTTKTGTCKVLYWQPLPPTP